MTKPKKIKKWLQSGACKSDYVIFADAFDLVFIESPEEIIEQHLTWNCDAVFGAEKNCFPAVGMACDYEQVPSPFKYLNSGFIVTNPEAMLTILESMNPESVPDDYRKPDGTMFEENDQYLYQLEYFKKPVNIRLDNNADLVINLCNVEEEELRIGGMFDLWCHSTGSAPLAAHFNGNAKEAAYKEKIFREIGL